MQQGVIIFILFIIQNVILESTHNFYKSILYILYLYLACGPFHGEGDNDSDDDGDCVGGRDGGGGLSSLKKISFECIVKQL